jgi:hypothetical protein
MDMEQMIQCLLAKMDVNQADQARIKDELDANLAKKAGKQEEMLVRMREDIKFSQKEMRSTVCAIRSG